MTYHASAMGTCSTLLSDPGYQYDTEESCLSACLDSTGCRGVTVDPNSGSCSLHTCDTKTSSGFVNFIAVTCRGRRNRYCIHSCDTVNMSFLFLVKWPLSLFLAYQKRFFAIFTSVDTSFLAYWTRFFAIFIGADKPYLTYPYPARGVDKKRITTRVVNTLYRMSRNSVVNTLGVDVIATSHTTSNFNMADVNMTR